MASVVTPSLSSIEQNAYNMGTKAVEILFNEIDAKLNDTAIEHQKITIDTELVLRNSC